MKVKLFAVTALVALIVPFASSGAMMPGPTTYKHAGSAKAA